MRMTISGLKLNLRLVINLVILICLVPSTSSHGLVTDPRQRGALRVKNRLVGDIDPNAPFDQAAHFPAGNKDSRPGSGKRSVERAAENFWTPYEPLKDDFKWRAGVCGDELGRDQEHLKGGIYYYPAEDPTRVSTYNQGDIIDIEVNVVSHHNGFFEFYICNLDLCPSDDISADCFKGGFCEQLMRAPSFCDSGENEDCGPVDPSFPGRWYLPCGLFPRGQSLYGGSEKGSMKFQLPRNLHCDHCVVQWYWTAANTCNPPGVLDYFQGPNAPRWPPCKGQGGATGGFTTVQQECKEDNFPEEYWQCSDVRILQRPSFSSANSLQGSPLITELNNGNQNLNNGNQNLNNEQEDSGGDNMGSQGGSFPMTFSGDGGNLGESSPDFQDSEQAINNETNDIDTVNPMNALGTFGKRRGPATSSDTEKEEINVPSESEKEDGSNTSGQPAVSATITPTPLAQARPFPTGADGLLNGIPSGFSATRKMNNE